MFQTAVAANVDWLFQLRVENIYRLAFADLERGGDVVEKTLLRRKVSWAPTQSFLVVIADFLVASQSPLEFASGALS